MPSLQDSPASRAQKAIPSDILAHIRNGDNLLIHGRAGTGKSTLLRAITEAFSKTVVLSPTGVAALNVGGQTIHSFLGMGFGFLQAKDVKSCSRQRQVLSKRPILIIDEVSMVRSDLFSAIDICLQKTLNNTRPFGGLQVILLGDTGQLPPVVVGSERDFFPDGSAMFFRSPAYIAGRFRHIELSHVYRQNHAGFIEFLSRVRSKTVTQRDIHDFNARIRVCDTDSVRGDNIVLCMTNRAADEFNYRQYEAIHSPAFTYTASVTGAFSDKEYPTQEELSLKVGAKVILLRNDPEGRWVNGTTAIVSRLTARQVWVKIQDIEREVTKGKWEKFKYESRGDAVHKTVAGSFEQSPLKLAWAITVHKSQGMTLDSFHLDLSTSPFEHGQLYVALSRARDLAGITLSRQLRDDDVRVDQRLLLT